jgi:hypothetical protein
MCGTKNFVSVRSYSAPQSHRTIVAILGICAYGTPKQVETRRHNQLTHYRRLGWLICSTYGEQKEQGAIALNLGCFARCLIHNP